MKTIVPMLTINKLTDALKAIRVLAEKPENIGTIFVCANETLKETEPEIETIKREAD